MIEYNDYKGLIPGEQQVLHQPPAHWQYGQVINGQPMVDPLLHIGCFMLGFDHPEFLDRVTQRLKHTKPEIAETYIGPATPLCINQASYELADRLYQLTEGYRSVFALSGSDANEGAIKLASAYHHARGDLHRTRIVSFTGSYHGSTWLTSNLSNQPQLIDTHYTMSLCADVIKLDRDFDLSEVDWNTVSCVMVETCSYAFDLTPFTEEFWHKLNQLQQRGVVVILDDIFVGGGKTGTFVGWKNLPIVPDIFTMGKGITSGWYPLSVTLYNQRIHQALPANFRWAHGFTYSFCQPGVISMLEFMDVLQQQQILDRHDVLVQRAREIFARNHYSVINQFGLIFRVCNSQGKLFFVIPLNATDEYFETLDRNLQHNDFHRV